MDGYYDGSIMQLARAETEGLLYDRVSANVHTTESALDGLEWCVAQLDARPLDSATYTENSRLVKNVTTVSGDNVSTVSTATAINTGDQDKSINSMVTSALGNTLTSQTFWYGLCVGSGAVLSLFYGPKYTHCAFSFVSSLFKSKK